MHLNNQHHDDHDSVPFERNLNFAAMQLLGYLRELGVVVDDLKAAGMGHCLTNAAPLVALEAQRARWDATVKGLRDDIAFHLGHPDKTEPALEKLAKKAASLRLYETGTSNLRLHTSFSGGESLLLIASGMTTRDLRRIIDLSSTAWDVLMHSLEAIFRDLLVQVGARMPPHPEKAPEEAHVHWVCSGCPSRSLQAGCPGKRLPGGQAA
jgi:hypothetical protein